MLGYEIPSGASTAGVAAAGGRRGVVGGVDSYAWERAYERTWDAVEEDERGLLRTDVSDRRRREARAASAASASASRGGTGSVQRGMLRHLVLVLDQTRAMEAADLKPSRAAACARAAGGFIAEFFDQNPISSLAVLVARRGGAERLTELSPARDAHLRALAGPLGAGAAPEGDFSLQAALELAARSLALVPPYGTREVLLLHGAHASIDPGCILDTLAELRRLRVTVGAISLPGEVYIAARLARETGGRYAVPESYDALVAQLRAHCAPPLRRAAGGAAGGVEFETPQMVPMGFPQHVSEAPAMCTCHEELRPAGYVCPRCLARQCDLPAACGVCGLQLVSAARLARSHHHLFPVRAFVEVAGPEEARGGGGRSEAAGDDAATAAAAAAAGAGSGENDARLPPPPPGKRRRHDDDEAGGSGDDGGGGNGGGGSSAAAAAASASTAAHDAGDSAVSAVEVGDDGEPLVDASQLCTGCRTTLGAARPRWVCRSCRGAFCSGCDTLIHETLHNCPGCCE